MVDPTCLVALASRVDGELTAQVKNVLGVPAFGTLQIGCHNDLSTVFTYELILTDASRGKSSNTSISCRLSVPAQHHQPCDSAAIDSALLEYLVAVLLAKHGNVALASPTAESWLAAGGVCAHGQLECGNGIFVSQAWLVGVVRLPRFQSH